MSGRRVRLDNLVADVRQAKAQRVRDTDWLSEAGWQEFHGFLDMFLGTRGRATRYLIEDALWSGAEKIRADLLTLHEPSPANVRARLDQCCRREADNELKRARVRLRQEAPADGPDPLDTAEGGETDRPEAALDAQAKRELLTETLAAAARELPQEYQVALWVQTGRDQNEIAKLLGKTPRMVRNYLDKLRWFMIDVLSQRDFDPAEVAGLLGLPRAIVDELIERHQ